MIHKIKTHVANMLGKCRICDYWAGVGIGTKDDEVCDKSKDYCPLWGVVDNDDHLTRIDDDNSLEDK